MLFAQCIGPLTTNFLLPLYLLSISASNLRIHQFECDLNTTQPTECKLLAQQDELLFTIHD